MKKLFLLISVVSLMGFYACSGGSKKEAKEDVKTEAVSSENELTVALKVEGMTCTGCESTIEKKVAALAGVTSVQASHVDGTVKVQLAAGELGEEQIKAAITEAGYKVTE